MKIDKATAWAFLNDVNKQLREAGHHTAWDDSSSHDDNGFIGGGLDEEWEIEDWVGYLVFKDEVPSKIAICGIDIYPEEEIDVRYYRTDKIFNAWGSRFASVRFVVPTERLTDVRRILEMAGIEFEVKPVAP